MDKKLAVGIASLKAKCGKMRKPQLLFTSSDV